MKVCLCHGVAKQEIEAAISSGARTIAEVGERFRAGIDCGGCHGALHSMLQPSRGSAAVAAHKGHPSARRPRGVVGRIMVSFGLGQRV